MSYNNLNIWSKESTIFTQTIEENPLLTRAEETAVAERAAEGDEAAIEKLVLCNIRFVFKIAQSYRNMGLDMDDLVSEGCIGLHNAARRFKLSKKCKFSTYASFWIKQRMRRALSDKSRTIRTPVYFLQHISTMRKVIDVLEDRLCREPTDREISEELNVPVSRVIQLKIYASQPISLETPIGIDGTKIEDLVEDSELEKPDQTCRRKNLYADIHDCMSTLSERERDVLSFRYGFHNNDRLSLEKISKKWGVTRERIRQIQCIAEQKMQRLMHHHEDRI